MFIDCYCDTEEESESPKVYNVNNPAVMGLWWLEGYDFVQSITQIQIFASQKVEICSDIPPYQLFRYDISANSFNCAMLESSLLDLLMM